MQKIEKALRAGYTALQAGAFNDARRHLRGNKHPKAVHLLGLVEKADGNFAEAQQLLQRAAQKDPRDPEIANNLGTVARQTGNIKLAEAEFRRAVRLRPEFRQPAFGLGRLLIDLERFSEALEVYESLVSDTPTDVFSRYGLATALLGIGQVEDAESIFDALVSEGNDQPQIRFMRGRCYLMLGQTDSAIRDLEVSYRLSPTVLALKALANTYFMTQDTEALLKLLEAALKDPNLAITAADILRQSGEPEKALTALDIARSSMTLPVESWCVSATAYIDLSNAEQAEVAARKGLTASPDNALGTRNLIVSLLMQGNAEDAMPIILKMRKTQPNDQQWLAYEVSALRLLGSERYREVADLARFVRPYSLPVPDGFADIATFNAAFLSSLAKLHSNSAHPLGQSLREGIQTPRDLTSIDDPVFKAFYEALDAPIRQYMADVGSGADHPLTARNTGDYKIAGGWSVRLNGGGRHVNHVHPEGWISSSYYVAVPEETKSADNRAGWIKFGEPPFDTSPPSPPEKWIGPEAGMLVLFPSFLWHGTEAIHDGSIRVTAPFDAVPV
jgi:tetratricopeptide (TPR) repeat protein